MNFLFAGTMKAAILSVAMAAPFITLHAQESPIPDPGGPGTEMTSSEKELYEKLGLSSTEWQKIKQSNLSLDRVHMLLESGITMTEYFRKPWMGLGLTEDQWVAGRRKGLTDEDMRSAPTPGAESAQWAVVHNVFLPGYHQFKRRQLGKGIPMAVIAGLSVVAGGSLAALTATGNNPPVSYAIFLFGLLPADMVWSAVDIHLQIQKELNPDAARFSTQPGGSGSCGVYLNVPLRIGKS